MSIFYNLTLVCVDKYCFSRQQINKFNIHVEIIIFVFYMFIYTKWNLNIVFMYIFYMSTWNKILIQDINNKSWTSSQSFVLNNKSWTSSQSSTFNDRLAVYTIIYDFNHSTNNIIINHLIFRIITRQFWKKKKRLPSNFNALSMFR